MVRHCRALLLVVAAAGSCLAQDIASVSSPGFRVSVDTNGWIRVWYRSVPVVTGSNFTISKPEWKGNAFPARSPAYRAKVVRKGETRVITVTCAVKDLAKNAITIEVDAQRVRIVNAYSIQASPDVGYVYTECFLSKGLLDGARFEDDAGHKGALEIAKEGAIPNSNLQQAILVTQLGKLTIDVAHEHTVAGAKGQVGWQLRNVCSREWGSEDRRTFSIPNVYSVEAPAPIVGRSEYVIRFEPSAAFPDLMAKRRAEQIAGRERRAAKRQALLDARSARLAENRGVLIVPKPQQMEVREGAFSVAPGTTIVAGSGDRRPAERLAAEVKDYFALELPIAAAAPRGGRCIVVGERETNAEAQRLLSRWAVKLSPEDPGPDGYVLEVRPGAVVVAGSDAAGTWYAVQSLLQLLRWDDERLVLPCLSVRDWPDFEVRGMMLTLGSRTQMDFLRHTMRRVLPRMKLNMVFIGGASLGKVSWPSHPEMAYPTAFTPADIRELADLARANFIEPVPHVQGFGHTGPLKKSHPELLAPGSKSRQPCFDITNPQAREFVFDIYKDAVDAFKPKQYFHVGFDEAQGLQLICKDQAPADVVAKHITATARWLEQRGLTMIMWADMLLDYEQFGQSSAAHSRAAHYGNVDTAPALGLIPKSILLANWYYRGAEDHPQLDHFAKAGFQAFPTTWFMPENNYNFLSSAAKRGIKWAAGSSWMYCSATNPAMMNSLLGEYAWTVNRPPLDELDYEPLGILADWLKAPRPSDAPCVQTPIDIKPAMNRSYTDDVPGDDRGWMDFGAEQDLSALSPGKRRLGRYVFDVQPPREGKGCVVVRGPKANRPGLPTSVVVQVGRSCDSLAFLHTAHYLDYGPRTLGEYVVKYADGQEDHVPLRNAINIGPWLRPLGLGWYKAERLRGHYAGSDRVWVGDTLNGDEVDVVAHEWVNPRPDAAIASVTLKATDGSRDLAIALLGLTAIERK